MTPSCNVCGSRACQVIYDSGPGSSLTSVCQPVPAQTVVWCCDSCGHVGTVPVLDEHRYYDSEYNINLNHEDEDQLYDVVDGVPVYRSDHQLAVLRNKIDLTEVSRWLDYGSAKGTMVGKVASVDPSADAHVFDVSGAYQDFWDGLVPRDRQAIHETPEDWDQSFDLVTSFFSLEHITDVRSTVRHVARLVRPEGLFYVVVPDFTTNVADLIVVDHVNHFTSASIERLLADAGFVNIAIDNTAHRGTMVVTARRSGAPPSPSGSRGLRHDFVGPLARQAAEGWTAMGLRAQDFGERSGAPRAIFGAGLYGAFVLTRIHDRDSVLAFLDNNPYLQGQEFMGRTVLPPSALPSEVRSVFLAVNPSVAASVARSEAHLLRSVDLWTWGETSHGS